MTARAGKTERFRKGALSPYKAAHFAVLTSQALDTKIRIMSGQEGWSVVFYRDEDGNSPVDDFLRSLDMEAQASIGWAIEQLRVRNVQAREPLVRHMEGKLWELRRESKTNIYRFLYFFFTGRRIVFVHGFQKKTEKTPRREIETAHARYLAFIKREGGE